MASGSSGHCSSARGGRPSGAAAAAAAASPPDSAFHGARRLAHMPAVDLVSHLIRRDSRPSDFVDVALELTTRERRFAGAEARARAAEEAAARLRGEMATRERLAAVAQDLTRRLVAAAEERLHAEIRAWQRRTAEAEARFQAAYAAAGRDISREHDDAPPSRGSLTMWPAGSALSNEQEKAQPEEEEAPPLQVASGKRKEKAVASSPPGKLSKKLKMPAWGGGSCSNAVPESEANPTDQAEAEAEDPWPAWEEAQDAFAIIPGAGWPHDAPEDEAVTKQGVGEQDQQPDQDKVGGEAEEFEHEPENPVALAVDVVPGNGQLPPNDDGGVEASRGAVPDEPEAGEESNMTEEIAGDGSLLRNKGMIYKMVFKALKEKERQATLASASQPNLRFWLHAPPPDDDKGKGAAPQQ